MYNLKVLKHAGYSVSKADSLNWIPTSDETLILKKNEYTCDCCGLVSRPHVDFPSGYMEIYHDKILCSMCMQSQHLDRPVNEIINHGLIIYCPTLSQGQIVKLAQWAYIARLRKNELSQQSSNLIGMITGDLLSPVSSVIPGFSSGDVPEFTEIYAHLPHDLRSNESTFSKLRYWPNEAAFVNQMEFWNVASFHNISDDVEG